MILSSVCIFLTLYLYYRFTEIQHSNLDTQNKVLAVQNQLADIEEKLNSISPGPLFSLSKELTDIHSELDNIKSQLNKERIDLIPVDEDKLGLSDSSGEKDSSSGE